MYDDIIWIYSFSGTYLLPYRIASGCETLHHDVTPGNKGVISLEPSGVYFLNSKVTKESTGALFLEI